MEKPNKYLVVLLTLLVLFVMSSSVFGEGLINLKFKNTDIKDVLQAISELADVNLVVDNSVQGNITIQLNGVTFKKALKLITQTQHLAYKWDDNNVFVATPERIKDVYGKNITTRIVKIENQNFTYIKGLLNGILPGMDLKYEKELHSLVISGNPDQVNRALDIIKQVDTVGNSKKNVNEDVQKNENPEIITRMVNINYAELKTLKEVLSGLNSSLNIQSEERNQKLIIHGNKDDVIEAVGLVKKLDTVRKQVLIEARVEEISRNNVSDIGVPFDQLSSLSELNIIKQNNNIEDLKINWPSVLEALEQKGLAKTLANPRLMTVDRETAKLLIGDKIPIPIIEQASDGTQTKSYEYKDVGITLQFKPNITDDNLIVLNVQPKVSSIGSPANGTSMPTIKTREIETTITLKDGETFAIGGLIQDDVIENIDKIPLLADIPILGEIFKHRSKTNTRTEIVIFITPHIIKKNSGQTMKQDEKKSVPSKSSLKDNKKEGKEVDNIRKTKDLTQTEVQPKKVNDKRNSKSSENKENQELRLNKSLVYQKSEGSIKGLNKIELERLLYQDRQRRNQDLPQFYNVKYKVKPGQTLADISNLFTLPIDYFQFKGEINSGDEIVVKVPKTYIYKVDSDDTLKSVGERFGFSVERIKRINEIDDKVSKNRTELKLDRILVLPFGD